MYTIPELDVLLKPAPSKTKTDKLATFMSSRVFFYFCVF